jgi:hypothetical protein
VRRGHHGDRLPGDIDAHIQAAGVDGREVFPQERFAKMGGIEPYVVEAALLHLEVDRPGDDVARRQLQARVVRRHEARPVWQGQVRAFAAERLGDQEAALSGVIQAGRVELDELHVRDPTARAPGHGDPVAGRGIGIRRVAVDLPNTASREHDSGGRERLNPLVVDVEGVHAVAAVRLIPLKMPGGDEVQRH